VTGWDLTFSAPKSVSTLRAVGSGEIGMEVRDAWGQNLAAGCTCGWRSDPQISSGLAGSQWDEHVVERHQGRH
jgi:hypothetical protein